MFSVAIKDAGVFSRFLASCDLDYVDVYLHDTVATFVMNTSDFFSVITMECTYTPNENSHSFRMARALLKQQKGADTISIRFTEDGFVSSSFMRGNTLLCDARFIQQKAYSMNYEDKLQILCASSKPYGLKLDMITPLIKLSLALGGVINIESGVACAIFQSGIRVYKKINYDEMLCITPKQAQILRTCDESIFSIENYVGAFKDNFAILINKIRVSSNAQYKTLHSARSQYSADIDFANLVVFACSHKMDIPSFKINLDERCCNFMEKEITYKVPVVISDEKRAKADPFHSLEIPLSIVHKILPGLNTTKVHIEKKQFFIQIDIGSYTIMYN